MTHTVSNCPCTTARIVALDAELAELKAALRNFVEDLRADASESLSAVDYRTTPAGDYKDGFSNGWDVGHARGLQHAARLLELEGGWDL